MGRVRVHDALGGAVRYFVLHIPQELAGDVRQP
jgi:hypothetical protein